MLTPLASSKYVLVPGGARIKNDAATKPRAGRSCRSFSRYTINSTTIAILSARSGSFNIATDGPASQNNGAASQGSKARL